MRFLTILLGIWVGMGASLRNPGQGHLDRDSLGLELTHAKSETEKAVLINGSTTQLPDHALLSALGLSWEAHKLIQDSLNLQGSGAAYNYWSVVLMLQNRYTYALEAALQAKDLLLKDKDERELSRTYINLGEIYKLKGEYGNAMEYQSQALRLCKQINDTIGMSLSYNNIGDIYSINKSYKLALENYRQALQLAQLVNDRFSNISNYADIARVWQTIGKTTEALDYYLAALELGQKQGNTDKTSEVQSYVAELYAVRDEPQKALGYLELAIALASGSKNLHNQMMVYYQAAVVYIRLGRDYQAINMAQKSIDMAKSAGNKSVVRDASQLLFELYLKRKDLEQTSFFQNQFALYRDSLLVEARKQDFAQKETLFELDLEKRENELLRKDKELREAKLEQSSYLILAVASILVSLCVIFWFLYQQNRQEHRNNAHLLELNQELINSKDEIKVLNDNLEQRITERTDELWLAVETLTTRNLELQEFSYILSHNIRLPISQMTGLINLCRMDSANSPVSPEMLDHLEKASGDLNQVVGDLNETLIVRRKVEHFAEFTSIPEILAQVLRLLNDEIVHTRAKVDCYFTGGETINAVKCYIDSIIYNLISNAIKYRSPKRRATVTFRTERAGGWLCLVVTDNGLGIDLANTDPYKIFGLYQRMHTHVEGKGLGLYMVKAQVEAMKGRIEVRSELDEGSEFRVYLPFLPE